MGSFKSWLISLSGVKTTLNGNSGLKGRIDNMVMIRDEIRQYVPNWSWDNFPARSWGPKLTGDSSCAAPVAVKTGDFCIENTNSASLLTFG